MEKKPLPLWRRILFYAIVAAIAGICILMVLDYLAGGRLGSAIEKISKSSEPVTFSELTGAGESKAGDANSYYTEALKAVRPENLKVLAAINDAYSIKMCVSGEQVPEDLRRQVVQNLANAQPILEKLDRGAKANLTGFDVELAKGKTACIVRLSNIQALAFLLSARTLEMILQGRDEMAAESIISMLKLTRTLDYQSIGVVYITKVNLVHFACRDTVLLLSYGQPSEKALAELQKVFAETIKDNCLEKMFLAEQVYQIEVARNLIPKSVEQRLFKAEAPDFPERMSKPTSSWSRFRLRWKLVQYFHSMDKLMKEIGQPWPVPLDIAGDSPERKKNSSDLTASGAQLIRSTADVFAGVRCTILAIMVERYRLAHGKLPASLADVRGMGLILLDPFTGNELLYKYYNDGSYAVYSAGTNRQDDGGAIKAEAEGQMPLDRGFKIQIRKPKVADKPKVTSKPSELKPANKRK